MYLSFINDCHENADIYGVALPIISWYGRSLQGVYVVSTWFTFQYINASLDGSSVSEKLDKQRMLRVSSFCPSQYGMACQCGKTKSDGGSWTSNLWVTGKTLEQLG